jgi:hypothetical protein
MELDHDNEGSTPPRGATPPKGSRFPLTLLLNGLVAVALAAAGYFGYMYLNRTTSSVPAASASATADTAAAKAKPAKVVQLDVLNGCGAKGVGAKFTAFLRGNGFDVVESKNYKTFTVSHTLVVDRVGDLAQARRVAAVLGVAERNVVQQINPDYFVDVSVVIGADYASLKITR